MELTGKCKTDFEKWFPADTEGEKGLKPDQIPILRQRKLKLFNSLTDSMQYGVLVDFFDSVGIYISDTYYDFSISQYGWEELTDGHYAHRMETRTKAIKRANSIYNEKFK